MPTDGNQREDALLKKRSLLCKTKVVLLLCGGNVSAADLCAYQHRFAESL